MIKRLILKSLDKAGYRIVKKQYPDFALEKDNMNAAIRRLLNLDTQIDSIVDIGAAKGSWTKMALNIFRTADYMLIEPLKEQIQMIPEDISNRSNVRIIEGVAGKEKGKVNFSVSDDLDGSGIYGKGENQREVQVYALDDILKDKEGLILLKLDTHGFEIPIFEGAQETLKRTEAIIVEVYGFHVSPTGLLFHEISDYLFKKDFRLFDIVDVMRRPKDEAFWQADAIYLKSSHPIYSDNSYQ